MKEKDFPINFSIFLNEKQRKQFKQHVNSANEFEQHVELVRVIVFALLV